MGPSKPSEHPDIPSAAAFDGEKARVRANVVLLQAEAGGPDTPYRNSTEIAMAHDILALLALTTAPRSVPGVGEGERHKAQIRQIGEAVTAFYGAMIDWVGHDQNPPQTVLDASKAIQRLTDPDTTPIPPEHSDEGGEP